MRFTVSSGRGRTMRTAVTAGLAAAVAVAALAVPALAATKSIKAADSYFVRPANDARISVKKNTTVRWNFVGVEAHDVTVARGPEKFRSGRRTTGAYTKKVTKVGTYNIVCTIHPGMGMTLRVVK